MFYSTAFTAAKLSLSNNSGNPMVPLEGDVVVGHGWGVLWNL